MKHNATVTWSEFGDMLFISVQAEPIAAYRFDYDATLDALNLMHNLRVSLAGVAGPGWQMLYRAAQRLETECEQYLRGN